MGIIAWIILGALAGIIAEKLVGTRTGLVVATIVGIVGALLGGFLAKAIFHVHSLNGFFNISTWITAIVGAAILLLVVHLVTGNRRGARV
ncbi:MAG TPA: GlsB/YeaQ/YmgE family stress response membrane protein [Actinocrinis sp.]|nr:GlsB/YeaQ/YmgE family stress response membrane protein [Actinocrinis sp.]